MLALNIKNLTKKYWERTVLDNVNLEIKEWDFYALLWHNGAGKTTLIWIITDLVNKTLWNIEVFENNIDTDFKKAKKCIWVVPQEFNFTMWEKVKNIPVTQAWYYWIDKKTAIKRTEKYLKILKLWDHRDKLAMELSGWMKRRLMIVRALIHEPRLLILDEPTAWVDVELRKTMWDFIKDLNKSWVTILLTTHYLEEVEELCNKVAILSKWKIVKDSSTKELLSTLDEEIFILDTLDIKSLNKNKEFLYLEKHFNLNIISDTEFEVTISYANTLNNLFEILNKNNIKITSMRNKVNRIEQLFINLTK